MIDAQVQAAGGIIVRSGKKGPKYPRDRRILRDLIASGCVETILS